MNQEDLKLGEIIEADRVVERDAIHIAVIPLEAHDEIDRGAFIRLKLNGKATQCEGDESIGVADPYISDWCIEPGQKFWACLKPGSITSLRHEWTHPAFPAAALTLDPNSIAGQVARKLGETESERYIKDEGVEIDLTFEEMLQVARDYAKNGNYHNTGSNEAQLRDAAQFWKHYEIVTGEKVPNSSKDSFFSCSC